MLIKKMAILIVVGCLLMVASRISNAAETSPAPTVEISDQAIQGGIVVVNKIVAAAPGWIVIHNGDKDAGFPAIGQAYVPAGETDSVAVLVEMDKVTPLMSATLHIDEGEKGKYEFPGADTPVKNGDKVVNTPFKVIALDIEDQFVSEKQTIKIRRIVAQQDGFVVIHSGAKDFPVIGYAQIQAGITDNLEVGIDVLKASPVMTAILHINAGALNKFEFPGADIPAILGGGFVNEAFWSSEHIRVRGQHLSGDSTLTVPAVLTRKDGWIVIRSAASGNPVIGVSPVKAGLNKNVVVQIKDPGTMTDLVSVNLHVDAGTAGQFEFPGPDAPVLDPAGNAIAPLMLTKNGVVVHDIKFEDIRKSGIVTVDAVLAVQNGWLVIHSSAEGSPAIGYTFVHAGYNPRVVVKVPPDAVTVTLLAMLHIDAGIPGKYEFPGADVPVKDDLGRVIAPKIMTGKPAPVKTPIPPTRVPSKPGPVATQRR